jgi:hypothetical protein
VQSNWHAKKEKQQASFMEKGGAWYANNQKSLITIFA